MCLGVNPNPREGFVYLRKQEWKGVNYLYMVADIPPDDVESISVLKDDLALTLYGLGALNGTILITKKSRKEKLPFNSGLSFDQGYKLYRVAAGMA